MSAEWTRDGCATGLRQLLQRPLPPPGSLGAGNTVLTCRSLGAGNSVLTCRSLGAGNILLTCRSLGAGNTLLTCSATWAATLRLPG